MPRPLVRMQFWSLLCVALLWLPQMRGAAPDADEIIDSYHMHKLNLRGWLGSGGRVFSLDPQRGVSAISATKEFRQKMAEGKATLGYEQLLFISLDTPPELTRGLKPLARLGEWGLWGTPTISSEKVAYLQELLPGVLDYSEDYQKKNVKPGELPFKRYDLGGPGEVQHRPRQEQILHQDGDAEKLPRDRLHELVYAAGMGRWDQFGDSLDFTQVVIMEPPPELMTINGKDQYIAEIEEKMKRFQREVDELGPSGRRWGTETYKIPVLVAPASIPRRYLAGLSPLVQLGRMGYFVPDFLPQVAQADLRYAYLLRFNSRAAKAEFAKAGLRPAIGGPDELRRLLERTPEHQPVTRKAASTPKAPVAAPLSAPNPAAEVAAAPRPSTDTRRPSTPTGWVQGQDAPVCFFGPPEPGLKEKIARRNAAFKRMQEEKSAKYNAWLKKQAEEAEARFKNNMYILGEFLRRSVLKHAQQNEDWYARVRAEGNRHDAIDTDLVTTPRAEWVFHNRTTAHLFVTCRFSGTVDGRRVEPTVLWTLVPAGQTVRQPANPFWSATGSWRIDPNPKVTWEARRSDNARY